MAEGIKPEEFNILDLVDEDLKIQLPAHFIVYGPTLSGKSIAVQGLLAKAREAFHPVPNLVIWCLPQADPYEDFLNKTKALVVGGQNIAFMVLEGIPDTDQITKIWKNQQKETNYNPTIVMVIDDLAPKLQNNPHARHCLVDHFCAIRHYKISLMFVTQFFFDPYTRCIRNNAHYFIFMHCNNVKEQMKRFLRQQGQFELADSVYELPDLKLYEYWLIDTRPCCKDYLLLRRSSNLVFRKVDCRELLF